MARQALAVAAIVALLFAPSGVAAVARKKPVPTWEDIARFYSGGNLRSPITYDWTNSMGTTGIAGSGDIRLNPKVKTSLDSLSKYGPRSQQGMVLGALGLSTLIHEALHNRQTKGDFNNRSEQMATDLGWRLIPDAMQRFFGIPIDSPWGRRYVEMVLKNLRQP